MTQAQAHGRTADAWPGLPPAPPGKQGSAELHLAYLRLWFRAAAEGSHTLCFHPCWLAAELHKTEVSARRTLEKLAAAGWIHIFDRGAAWRIYVCAQEEIGRPNLVEADPQGVLFDGDESPEIPPSEPPPTTPMRAPARAPVQTPTSACVLSDNTYARMRVVGGEGGKTPQAPGDTTSCEQSRPNGTPNAKDVLHQDVTSKTSLATRGDGDGPTHIASALRIITPTRKALNDQAREIVGLMRSLGDKSEEGLLFVFARKVALLRQFSQAHRDELSRIFREAPTRALPIDVPRYIVGAIRGKCAEWGIDWEHDLSVAPRRPPPR